MKTTLQRRPASTLILLMLVTCTALADDPQAVDSAAGYLTFETKIDGRCHNLSEGGKLAVMHNTHPTRKIDFRLIRYYVDVRQWGRVTGTAEPDSAPVKLGCTLVGGREQRWEVERANFNEETEQ